MRLLLDNNLSVRLVELLVGLDVEHVRRLGLHPATDEPVLAPARMQRVLVSADTDFDRILTTSRAIQPIRVLIRRLTGGSAEAVAELLLANLATVGRGAGAGVGRSG